jgi:cytochrome c peroxidase
VDERLGVARRLPPGTPDLVRPKLEALRAYQLSLAAPRPKAGSFDAAAAQRGLIVFEGTAKCATCHSGAIRSNGTLHAPQETGVEPGYAAHSASKRYRATPLRGLWQHPPYFHDGTANSLAAVVDHYDRTLQLALTPASKADLVEYLKSL